MRAGCVPTFVKSHHRSAPSEWSVLRAALGAVVMKFGLYAITLKGLDGVDWPVGGVAVLQDGVIAGGGTYTYFTGRYSSRDGILRGELVLNPHRPLPSDHVFFNATDVGIGITGTYEGDQAELTGTALVGKKSLGVHVTLRLLARLGAGWQPPDPFVF